MTGRMKKKLFGLVSVVLLIAVIFSVTLISTDAADVDYSYYNISSAAASYLNKTLSPSADDDDAIIINPNNVGNAGSYVGYCDEEKTGGLIYGWVMSALSSSSATYSYATFKENSDTQKLYYYSQYGNLLTQLGLDSTATEGTDVIRFIAGLLMLMGYIMSISVPGIFKIAIDFLKLINPFKIFGGISKVAQWAGWSVNEDSIFAGIFGMFADWYNALVNLSWVVVPLFFAALIVTLLLARTANKATKVKKYIIRVVFICIGVPVCAALYTSCLNNMSELLATNNMASTKVIASTFVDFGKWVESSNLAPPSGAVFNMNNFNTGDDGGGIVKNSSYTGLRKTCMLINADSGVINGFTAGNQSFTAEGTMTYDTIGGADDGSGNDAINNNGMKDTIAMLTRYMTNDFYHASDFESANKDVGSGITADRKEEWFKEMTKEDGWGKNDDDHLSAGMAKKVAFNGRLYYLTGSYGCPSGEKGLSNLSMYNYLSTKFTQSSVIVYSNEKSSSGFVRESHHSVNIIGGSGLMSFLYYMNALVLMYAYTVIGWFYAIALFMTNLKRGIKSISSIPFALLGSIPAIAKTITYVIMLVVEIIGTIFVYSIISEILFSLNTALESIFTTAFNSVTNVATISIGNTPTAVFGGTTLIVLILAAQSIFLIWFTIMAVKLRKSIVRTMDEFVGSFIDHLFDVGNNAPTPQKSPGLLSRGAGAVASGAAMGAGQRLGNSVMSKKPQSASGPQGTAKGTGTGVGGNTVDNSSSLSNIGNVGGTSDIPVGDESGYAVMSLGSGTEDTGLGNTVGNADDINNTDVVNTGLTTGSQEHSDKMLGEQVSQMSSLAGPIGSVANGNGLSGNDDEKRAIKDAEAERNAKAAMGQTTALEDEQYEDDKAQIKKDANAKSLKAGGEVVVGGAKAVAGAYTGNAQLVQDGAKDVANGVNDGVNAQQQKQNAPAVAMEKEQQRENAKSVGSDNTVNSMNVSDFNNSDAGNTSSINNANSSDNGQTSNAEFSSALNSADAIDNTANEQSSKNVESVSNTVGDVNNNQSRQVSSLNNAGDVNSTQSKQSRSSAVASMSDNSKSNNVSQNKQSVQSSELNSSHSTNSSNAKGAVSNVAQSSSSQGNTSNKIGIKADSVSNSSSKNSASSASSVKSATAVSSQVSNSKKKNVSNKTVKTNSAGQKNVKSVSNNLNKTQKKPAQNKQTMKQVNNKTVQTPTQQNITAQFNKKTGSQQGSNVKSSGPKSQVLNTGVRKATSINRNSSNQIVNQRNNTAQRSLNMQNKQNMRNTVAGAQQQRPEVNSRKLTPKGVSSSSDIDKVI